MWGISYGEYKRGNFCLYKKIKSGIPFRIIAIGFDMKIDEVKTIFHSDEYSKWRAKQFV